MRTTRTAIHTLVVLCAGVVWTTARAADASSGEMVFNENCAICHTHIEGLMDKSGPNLRGLINRQAGTIEYRFGFTDLLARSGIQWSTAALDVFIQGPARMIRGTKMVYPGLEDPAARADLICYLQIATNTGGQPVASDCTR
jgi:cytochrome c